MLSIKFYIHVNSPASADEIQLKCKKVRFLTGMRKTHLLAFQLIFVSSSWWVYMYVKLDIQNENLEWYKKRSMFAK